MAPELQQLLAQPWPDGKRVLVSFLWDGEGPVDVELTLRSAAGDPWAQMLVVGLNEPRMDLTLHLRVPVLPGAEGTVTARLLHGETEADSRTAAFVLPGGPTP
ncbi:MAG: hypothetical protein QHH80_14640 [Anaerolineae bacterium]|nr:hypothetical protein [Anaerolineae bacterium]